MLQKRNLVRTKYFIYMFYSHVELCSHIVYMLYSQRLWGSIPPLNILEKIGENNSNFPLKIASTGLYNKQETTKIWDALQ